MSIEQLVEGLTKLRLHAVLRDYPQVSRDSEKLGRSYEQFLAALIELEVEDKTTSKREKYLKDSKIPLVKLVSDFDFTGRKGITPQEVARLCTGEFVQQASNVVFYGTFGVGKSHLAMAIARELCMKDIRCLFTTASTLMNDLCLQQRDLALSSYFKKLDKYDLIILDELGYTPQTKEGADLFFQFISERYERRSIMITTNLAYSEWDKVFLSPITTAAAVDRIIHKSETFNITGQSKRAEEALKRQKDT